MLISKPMPAITWSLFDPTAGGWEFANDPARLVQGNPRLKTRLFGTAPEDAPQIQMDFATPYTPRLFAVIARSATTSGSPGFAMTGRPAGGDTFSVDLVPGGVASLYRLPDGTLTGVYLSTNTVEVDAIRVSYGPVDGTTVDIGQIVAADAFEFCITRDWQEQRENLTRPNETITGQDFPVVRPSRRLASVTVAPVSYDSAIAGGDSLQELQASLSGRRPVLVVPMTRGVGRGRTAPVDQESVARSALFGACTDMGAISIVGGSNLFHLPLKFTERPG
jgi:hypothetical protein